MTETNSSRAARAAASRAVLRLLTAIGSGRGAAASHRLIDAEALRIATQRGWVRAGTAPGEGATLTPGGREFLRRALSGQDMETAAAATRTARAAAEATARPATNDSESPLAWLRRHKGRDGGALIGDEEFRAGERLRADFWFARMSPRVTVSWEGVGSGSARRGAPGAGVEMSDGAVAAGERVRRALAAVGPELAGVLLDVCCHLKGIEEAERAAGWPQRSGKVVLGVALKALARHYGIAPPAASPTGAAARPRHWGTDDFRPTLAAWRDGSGEGG